MQPEFHIEYFPIVKDGQPFGVRVIHIESGITEACCGYESIWENTWGAFDALRGSLREAGLE